MCLERVSRSAKKPQKIVGYRVAIDCGDGLYSPVHQSQYMRFRVGGEYHYHDGDGFHVFFSPGAAWNYRGSSNSKVVLQVECTNVIEVGKANGEPAFTCKNMKVMGLAAEPAKVVSKYYKDNCPGDQTVYWMPDGSQPTIKSKGVQEGYGIVTYTYEDTCPVKGKGNWCLIVIKDGSHILLPVDILWVGRTRYVTSPKSR